MASIDKKQKTNPCYISNLPDHILQYILCRLPISSFLRCRYVCKSWRQILSNPNFVELYGGFTNVILCVQKDLTSMQTSCYTRKFRLLESNSDDYRSLVAQFAWSRKLPSDFRLINSCNGLVCIFSRDLKKRTFKVLILNPITGEYIILPPHDKEAFNRKSLLGLGFCPKHHQYMVISIYKRDNTMQAEVYTLGIVNCKWRSIGVMITEDDGKLPRLFNETSCTNLYVNGSFHWLMVHHDGLFMDGLRICAFDFESEQFRFFALPALGTKYHFADLGVFRNSLYFCCHDPNDLYTKDVWVMNKYGVKDSWTKMLVIDFSMEKPLRFDVMKFFENGNLLLSSVLRSKHDRWETVLFSYNPETKHLSRVDSIGGTPISEAVQFKPSFASLEEVVGDKSMVLNGFV